MKKKQNAALALVLAALLAACAVSGPAPGGGDGPGAVSSGDESRAQSAPEAPVTSAPPQILFPDTGVYTPTQRSETQKNGQLRGVYSRRRYVSAEQELDWALVAERTGLDVAELQKNNPGLEFSPFQKSVQVVLEPEYRCEPDLDETDYKMWDDNGWLLMDMTAPSALGKENLRLLAQAADIRSFYEVSVGFWPAEVYGEEVVDGQERSIYRAGPGARFTRYSELKVYVESVWTPEKAWAFLHDPHWGGYPAYFPGPKDELLFFTSDRGTNIDYITSAFTAPQVGTDGSVIMTQIAYFTDLGDPELAPKYKEAGHALGDELPVYYVETSTVELVPTENGMRVAQYAMHH